jgi:hypothetical protein
MEPNTTTSLFELQVDHESSDFLKETARWGKFLAIVGFVGSGLCVLTAIFAGSFIASFYGSIGAAGVGSGVGAVFSVMLIIVALLWFFPCLYLYNFSSKMQAALRSNDQVQLNQSFRNLKAYYRFVGILTIIGISLYALAFIIRIFSGSH